MTSSCEDSNELSDTIKGRKFLEYLRDYQLTKQALLHGVN
jgi:hypothetical protein